ncbi:MAG TPA: hypothetical protein VGP28_04385 [Methylocella sp.]|jgi:hypothetical protein|nr:hypothetical protein [Methylocella sp.]
MNLLHAPVGRPRGGRTRIGAAPPAGTARQRQAGIGLAGSAMGPLAKMYFWKVQVIL